MFSIPNVSLNDQSTSLKAQMNKDDEDRLDQVRCTVQIFKPAEADTSLP